MRRSELLSPAATEKEPQEAQTGERKRHNFLRASCVVPFVTLWSVFCASLWLIMPAWFSKQTIRRRIFNAHNIETG